MTDLKVDGPRWDFGKSLWTYSEIYSYTYIYTYNIYFILKKLELSLPNIQTSLNLVKFI